MGVQRRLHPPKPHVEKNLVLSICLGSELKSPVFDVVGKFMHHRSFCVGTFSNPFEIFFASSIETFHAHELPSLLIC